VARTLAPGVELAGRAVAALNRATVEQVDAEVFVVRLRDELAASDWRQVDTVLRRVAGGGRYRQGTGVHRYDRDPGAEIAAVVATGMLPPDPKQQAGWFATPRDVADNFAVNYALLELEELPHTRRLSYLDPSAGEGALANAMVKFHCDADQVTCVEADPYRAAICQAKGYTTHPERFQDWAAHRDPGALPFDVVVMNPPFAEDGDKLAWARHVLLAWSLVGPGGVLTAIVPVSVTYHRDRAAKQVRELADRYGHVYDHFDGFHFDRDPFAEAGAGVKPVIVHLRRPLWLEPQPEDLATQPATADDAQPVLF
jgi:predicted RNA methylase